MLNHTPNYAELTERITSNAFNTKDSLKQLPLHKIVEHQKSITKSIAVMCLNVTGDLDVGSIIRTSVAFGVKDFYLVGRRKQDKRSNVGAHNYIDIHKYDALLSDGLTIDPIAVKEILIKNKLFPIFIEQADTSQILGIFDWKEMFDRYVIESYTPVIVFGNEGIGIDQKIIHMCGGTSVEIKMPGVMRSLNVSNAASIVLFDLFKGMEWL